mmetsp:Transcript_34496/g.73606  ORF Transcript_34496/g.73606 Transcript_34496/m.73606 type:complete len:130 (-) Transcript_34496:277-666(-)
MRQKRTRQQNRRHKRSVQAAQCFLCADLWERSPTAGASSLDHNARHANCRVCKINNELVDRRGIRKLTHMSSNHRFTRCGHALGDFTESPLVSASNHDRASPLPCEFDGCLCADTARGTAHKADTPTHA